MKICKDCKVEKSKTDFYPTQGECKECTRKRVKLRESKLKLNPEWIKKERERHREKYKRLNYKESQKVWDKDKPWKTLSRYKGLHAKLKIEHGIELHHWNYNIEFIEDVFILKASSHKQAHRFLSLDIEKRMFKDIDGNYLDTREKHLDYLISKGIEFKE